MSKLTIDLTADDINEIVIDHLRQKYNLRLNNSKEVITLNWVLDQTGCQVLVDEVIPPTRVNEFEIIARAT